jgi:hypothetical protein
MSLRVSLGLSITALNRILVSDRIPAFIQNLITQDGRAVLTQNGDYIQVHFQQPVFIQSLITQDNQTVLTQSGDSVDVYSL